MMMARTKNKIRSIRVSITGFLSPALDGDVLGWLDTLPKGKKFTFVMNILKIVIGLLESESGTDIADIKSFVEQNEKNITIPKMAKRIVSLKLRFRILERDKYRCVICGRSAEDGVKLQVDHIHPKSKGGIADESNLATLCFDCNIGKRDRVLSEGYLETIRKN
jgi:hypothetical protein